MYFETNLKVIALGTDITLKRLYSSMAFSGIEVAGFPVFSELISRLQQESFDVILLDSLHPESCDSCKYLADNGFTPIALLIREKEANWQTLCSWEVDGFIAEGSSSTEMIARIMAVARRKKKIPVA